MPYLQIDDFKFGMDRRRPRQAGVPGALWTLQNAVISRGGDIERARSFVPKYTLPSGCFGLLSSRSQIYTFGSASNTAAMPIGVQFVRLQHPSASAMTRLWDAKTYQGHTYAIAEFADGSIHHYYDTTRVTDWDTISAEQANFNLLAERFAARINETSAVEALPAGNVVRLQARTAGVEFTLSTSAVNGIGTDDQTAVAATLVANVAPVTEVLATAAITITGGTAAAGANKIDQITINGVNLMSDYVNWRATNAATAISVSGQINANTGTSGYSASVIGATITIAAAAGTGATPNGYAVTVSSSGDVAFLADGAMHDGVTGVTAVAQISTVTFEGTYELDDTYTLTVDGVDYKMTGQAAGMGTSIHVEQKRGWSPVGSVVRYCTLDDFEEWDPAAPGGDAGFLNVASESDGNTTVVCAAKYQTRTAFFSESTVTLYTLDTNPANFAIYTTAENTGTVAPKSVIRFGNDDVFYLDQTGLRSLRARDSSNAPFVSDVGNAIDTFVQEWVASIPRANLLTTCSAIEPLTGRLFMAIKDRVFVLSYFPGTKISAWSYLDLDFDVEAFARTYGRLYAKSGDKIYLYGGDSGLEYPAAGEQEVVVEFPFLGGGKMATFKDMTAVDLGATNAWNIELLVDPNDETQLVDLGPMIGNTYNKVSNPAVGRMSVFGVRLTCDVAGAATLSSAAIHYETDEAT